MARPNRGVVFTPDEIAIAEQKGDAANTVRHGGCGV